jgi:hypothetical protein
MTKPRNDTEVQKDSPFSAWVRNHPELDSRNYGYDFEDLDCIWHQYVDGKMMLLEMKQYMTLPSYAQVDTHSIINQCVKFACSHPDFYLNRKNKSRPTKIQYFGYYVVKFERTNPEDGCIYINGIEVTKEEFLRFLQFEYIPTKPDYSTHLDF